MIGLGQKDEKVRLAKSTLNAAFPGLEFNEEEHAYTYNNKKLISTTTFLKKFYEPFQSYMTAKRVAEHINKKLTTSKRRTTGYYLERWEQIALTATSSGSRVHNFLEYGYPDFIDKPICDQEVGGMEFFNNLDPKYEILFLELRMYLLEYNKAGTADIIILNKETGNIVIADWKTNRKNLLQVYKNKRLKEPFKHLYATDINKYSLQLSDYQNMIEMNTPYKVEDRWVIHLSSEDWKVLDRVRSLSPDKYHIDLTVEPVEVTKYYQRYSTTDYSKELRNEYLSLKK